MTGEVRPVANAEARYAEARRRGIERVIVPASQKDLAVRDASIDRVRTIGEALERLSVASKSATAIEVEGVAPPQARAPRAGREGLAR